MRQCAGHSGLIRSGRPVGREGAPESAPEVQGSGGGDTGVPGEEANRDAAVPLPAAPQVAAAPGQ